MGSSSRAKPGRLSEKLLLIRETLGFSQSEMGRQVGLDTVFARNYVSSYERGTREPTLEVLLRYSEVSGCWMNALVDDDVDLPKHLPSERMHEGIRRARHKRGGAKAR